MSRTGFAYTADTPNTYRRILQEKKKLLAEFEANATGGISADLSVKGEDDLGRLQAQIRKSVYKLPRK
jgi:hypothetical protein